MTNRPAFPLPRVKDDSGKEGRGRVLITGGSAEIPGAVLLAGMAALRVGAGKLQFATVASVARLLAVAMPEARVIPLEETAQGSIAFASDPLLAAAKRADALIVGPGCDPTAQWLDIVGALARESGGTLLLDAGALPAVEAVEGAPIRCIVTPHAGEMASVTGLSLEAVERDAGGIAQRYCERNGCVVVLKGATTHVCAPGVPAWVHTGGSISLGTSGSGDVLAGIIGGLAARGAAPVVAAQWGVYLHGLAGRQFEDDVADVGLLARDLPAMLPALLRKHAGH